MNSGHTHVNLETLSRLRELQSPGCPDVLEELVQIFLSTSSKRILEILNAITQKDEAELKLIVHTLRSSAATLGADDMAQLCSRMEDLQGGQGSDVLMALFIQLK